MLKIQVLGPGCSKCTKLAENTKAAADELGLEYTLEKITDLQQILDSGVMTPPALIVDGEIKLVGKAANASRIKELLQ
jgi:small redox-active disulfide protein 2